MTIAEVSNVYLEGLFAERVLMPELAHSEKDVHYIFRGKDAQGRKELNHTQKVLLLEAAVHFAERETQSNDWAEPGKYIIDIPGEGLLGDQEFTVHVILMGLRMVVPGWHVTLRKDAYLHMCGRIREGAVAYEFLDAYGHAGKNYELRAHKAKTLDPLLKAGLMIKADELAHAETEKMRERYETGYGDSLAYIPSRYRVLLRGPHWPEFAHIVRVTCFYPADSVQSALVMPGHV